MSDMSAPSLFPPPEPAQPERPKIQMRWKWALTFFGALLAFGMYQCGTAMYQGRELSNAAVRHFHDQLNAGQFEGIINEADPAFAGEDRESVTKFLAAIHRKMGDAGAENMVNIQVNTDTSGTYIVTRYTTTFGIDLATETFTWRKNGSALALVGYNIQSKKLIIE